MHDWLPSLLAMILSFPALCIVLLCYVHGVVECAPMVIREHRVTYRPIKTHIREMVLILRLAFVSLHKKADRRS